MFAIFIEIKRLILNMGLSNNKIKYIRSLAKKKHRNEHQTFVAEGDKLVSDLLETGKCQLLVALPEWLDANPGTHAEEMIVATPGEIKKATFLQTPPPVLAVFYRPEWDLNAADHGARLSLVLDGVQDPGNVGTIVRTADWFGIDYIFCSRDTADIYNPKTVQATMGAIARVKVIYTDIATLLRDNHRLPIYGTFLDGNPIYDEPLSPSGFIVMGSEGSGISEDVTRAINRRLYIPGYPKGINKSESLNVAIATAITCAEFRRRGATKGL